MCFLCILFARSWAQPLSEVQEYLDDYAQDLRIANLPSAAEGVLLSKLLTTLPVEPRQYAGQSNITFEPNSDNEGRFAVLLPALNESEQATTDLPAFDDLWQVYLSYMFYVSLSAACGACLIPCVTLRLQLQAS